MSGWRTTQWRTLSPVLLAMMAHPTDARQPDSPARQAERYIASLEKPDAPGCVLGANQNGHGIFRGAFGLADTATGRRNMPDEILGVGSVTKQFAATAVAMAAREGHFSLDDPISRYLPEMANAPAITIEQLVHHTSGLRDIGRLIELTGRPGDYHDLDSRVALLGRQRATNFTPGQEFRYNNSGYILLAALIERTTGEAFATYVRNHIFQPLGMRSSYFGENSRGDRDRALPYGLADGRWVRTDGPFATQGGWGATGLMTSLDDFGRWADNLVSDHSALAGGQTLIAELKEPGKLTDGESIPYGFGLRLVPYRGLPMIGHGGSADGYKAATMIFPDRKLAVFGFCNNGEYADTIVERLADIFLELPGDAKDDAPSPSARPMGVAMSLSELQQFEGVYREPSLRLPLTVTAEAEGLRVTGANQPALFVPIGPTRFRGKADDIMAFEQGNSSGEMVLVQEKGVQFHFGTARFERIHPIQPTPEELQAYTGRYTSTELGASYDFFVEGGALRARIVNSEQPRTFVFRPMIADEFVAIPDRLVLRFERVGDRPAGFVLTHQFGWITDVRFERDPR